MIHPKFTRVFPDNGESLKLFSWIAKEVTSIEDLKEFVKWHMDLNREVILQISKTLEVNFEDTQEAKRWAEDFLGKYDKKIRDMRSISNQVFDRYHKLKNEQFDRIIKENNKHEQEIKNLLEIFLNKNGLLIGKIIFAYRETWFLAKQISNPDFKLGSVQKYTEWVDANISNLKELNNSLEQIYKVIVKTKE